MRSESQELRLMTGSKRMPSSGDGLTRLAFEKNSAEVRDALDVAFENYTRVDCGSDPIPNLGAPNALHAKATTKAIIDDIAAQLDALDRQRQKLADLLRDVSL